jgi:Holliday junction resolvase
MKRLVSALNGALRTSGIPVLKGKAFKYNNLPGMDDESLMVQILLNSLCLELDKELVVFFDEADCLSYEAPLITFLRQIRLAHNSRPLGPANKFPQSIVLVGMRDIRDYLFRVRPDEESRGLASPFNIKKDSLTLKNFTVQEIEALYRQHTEESSQVFDRAAIDRVWYWSEGQPWLINALAYEVIVNDLKNNYSISITASHIDKAAEALIKRRDTHIDSLLEKLTEPCVIKVMDAVFAGTISPVPLNDDDRRYCIDLGLVVKDDNEFLRPTNQIYKEVMSRVITDQIQFVLDPNITKKQWTDGKVLFVNDLLTSFQNFYRKNSESFPKHFKNLVALKFDEATFAFMLFSYFQKAVNSGAEVHREYAEGRGLVDLVAIYQGREYLIEVKLQENSTLGESLEQLAGYLDRAGEDEGWLVIFDPKAKPWKDKVSYDKKNYKDYTIHVFWC